MALGDWLRRFRPTLGQTSIRLRRRPGSRPVAAQVQVLEPRQMLSSESLYVSHRGTVNFTPNSCDPSTYSVDAGPAHGSLTQNADYSWTYNPDDDYVGSDYFTLVGMEETSGGPMPSQPYEVDAWVYNEAPSGQADNYSAVVGHAITLKVVGNDSDGDGDPMTIEIVDNIHAFVDEYADPAAPPPPSWLVDGQW